MSFVAAYLCHSCGQPGDPDSAVADEVGNVYDGAHEGCIDDEQITAAEYMAAIWPDRRGYNSDLNRSNWTATT